MPLPLAAVMKKESNMRCPVCPDAELKIAERQGVEIDYCPRCRGIWLDRGELDKIIERSCSSAPAPDCRVGDHHDRERNLSHGYRGHDDHDHDRHAYEGDRHHKRKSFLKDLFDF